MLLLLGAGGLHTHLGNICILRDASEQVLMYLLVQTCCGRVSMCVGAAGQGKKVMSCEVKLIQRNETKVDENRSQKWKYQELGTALDSAILPQLPHCQHPAGCSWERKEPRGRQ